ncbi:MAG: MFS transporter [Myxococcota bacterium]
MTVRRPPTASPAPAWGWAGAPHEIAEAFVFRRSAPAEGEGTSTLSPRWLRRSLSVSVAEGMLAEVVTACTGGAVLTAWALHLGFGPAALGIVCALPIVAQVFHLPAALLTQALGSRRLSLGAVALARLVWLALLAIPLLDLPLVAARAVFVGTVAASALLGVIGNNAWVAWMADLVPASMQGRYFGRRTAAATLCATASALLTGVGVDHARRVGAEEEMLVALAVLAAAAGVGCFGLMARQRDRRRSRRDTPPLATLLEPLRDPALRPLLAYQLAWNAAVGLGASFFALYMLRDLRMGFTLVTLHATAAATARTLAAPAWGRLLDRVGGGRVLAACTFGLSATVLVWPMLGPDLLWPLAIEAVVAGALWAGHGLALFGLPLRIAPPSALPAYVGALSSAAGLAFAVGAAAGSVLAAGSPGTIQLAGHTFSVLQGIFLLGASMRLVAGGFALRLLGPGR